MSRLPTTTMGGFGASPEEQALAVALATTPADQRAAGTTIVAQGDPEAARRRREEQTHRHQFQELSAQRALLERRRDSMNPRAYAAQVAGVEYDLAKFEADARHVFADQRTLRQATKDVETFSRMFRSGEINEQQLAKVVSATEQQYGANTLLQIDEWRELTGVQGAYQQQIQQAVQARAEQTGTDASVWQWDERSGRPVLDQEAYAVRTQERMQAREDQKPVLAARKMELDLANRRVTADLRPLNEAMVQAIRKGNNAEANQLRKQARERIRQYENFVRRIEGASSAALSGARPANLPLNAEFAGAFQSPAEAQEAGVPNGAYATISGHTFRKNAQGQWEKAN